MSETLDLRPASDPNAWHVTAAGMNVLVVIRSVEFASQSKTEQISDLEKAKAAAKDIPTSPDVAFVWATTDGRMAYLSSHRWHGILATITLDTVWANRNTAFAWRS